MILGIDEVGRGPWAGPLVVGAVVLPGDVSHLEQLTDSKKLTARKREALDVLIRDTALGWGLGWVHADELDTLGLAESLRVAAIRAVEAVKAPYHEIVIDGTINFLKETTKGQYVSTIPKADLLVPAVSAASIIAKVARDAFMKEQDVQYPHYGFSNHVGYGTAKHRAALAEHGVTPLHRTSFAPIAALLTQTKNKVSVKNETTKVSSTKRGLKAEQAVADFLLQAGYSIIERNWKTKRCEIDIIAETAHERYFVEVKYRSSSLQGDGFEAITPKKLQQMHYAADTYNARCPTQKQPRLMAAAVNASSEVTLLALE